MTEAHVEALDRTVQRNAIDVATGRDLDRIAWALMWMRRVDQETDEPLRKRLKWELGL